MGRGEPRGAAGCSGEPRGAAGGCMALRGTARNRQEQRSRGNELREGLEGRRSRGELLVAAGSSGKQRGAGMSPGEPGGNQADVNF